MKTLYLILSFCLFIATAHATNRTWNGSTNGYWSWGPNWTPSGVPTNGDILTFPGGTPFIHTTNNVPNLKLNQIYFTGNSTPTIEGDQITVTNTIFSNQSSGFSYVNMACILADSSVFPNPVFGVGNGGSSTASLVLQNQIRLNNHDLTLSATDTNTIIFVEGPIQETGNVIVKGPGTTRFSDVNTYTGTTTLQSGALELGTVAGIAIPGDLVVGDGVGGQDADVVRLLAASDIGNVAVTVNSSGLLDLNGYTDGFDTLTLNSGHVATGTGTVAFHSLTASFVNSFRSIIEGKLNLGTILVPMDVSDNVGVTYELAIYAEVRGTGGLEKRP